MSAEKLVHVIEDDDAMRDSLAFLLSASDLPVRTYESGTQFLASMATAPEGCIVTDVRMPGITGIDLLRKMKATGWTVPVIVITGHGDVAMAVSAMKLGAADFFEKPFDDEKFIGAVRLALSATRQGIVRSGARAEILERLAALSARERQVLDGLVEGLPNKTIAFDLGISARTVEVYRANLMAKMQAKSLSELVRMALAAGTFGEGPSGS